jgi:hypothetical protein
LLLAGARRTDITQKTADTVAPAIATHQGRRRAGQGRDKRLKERRACERTLDATERSRKIFAGATRCAYASTGGKEESNEI